MQSIRRRDLIINTSLNNITEAYIKPSFSSLFVQLSWAGCCTSIGNITRSSLSHSRSALVGDTRRETSAAAAASPNNMKPYFSLSFLNPTELYIVVLEMVTGHGINTSRQPALALANESLRLRLHVQSSVENADGQLPREVFYIYKNIYKSAVYIKSIGLVCSQTALSSGNQNCWLGLDGLRWCWVIIWASFYMIIS